MSFSGVQTRSAPRSELWANVRDSIRGVPRDYTTVTIGRTVVLLAIPMVLEMSMQSLFAVVDVFFVARLGPEAVAILGLSDSLLALIFAVAMGLSMGTAAMVSRRVGEGSTQQAAVAAVQALFIEPGSPWENGYVESFNGTLRDELLDREIFYTLTKAKILIERWRRQYNSVRPHSALGYCPPAPEAVTPAIVDSLNMSCAPS